MNLLEDDRQQYGIGALVSRMVSKKVTKAPKVKYGESYESFSGMKNSDKFSHSETERFLKEHGYTEGTVDDLVRDGMQNYELTYGKNGEITSVIAREKMGDKIEKKVFKNPRLDKIASYMGYAEGGPVRVNKAKGGSLLEDDMPNKGLEALREEAPEVVERMGYEEGGTTTANDRYDAFIKQDIKILQGEERDSYLKSGQGIMGSGILAKADMAMGGFGNGERLVNDLRKVRREMGDNATDAELINKINSGFAEAGVDFQVSESFSKDKVKKYKGGKMKYAEGGSLLQDDMAMVEENMPMNHMPINKPMMEEPMMEQPQEDMLPDDEMEDEFIDYILDTALTDEEEEMLMSKLEQDGEMSMLFDKVIDVAQEFAGSGPVEGPGSGVSDSIPARLSDGEFVFTAAAVEEIGADNLMAMMKDAEMKAEERQGLAEGGMPEEEETVTMEVQEQKEPKVQIAKATVNSNRGLLDEDEISKGIKSKMMLDPLQRHVRS